MTVSQPDVISAGYAVVRNRRKGCDETCAREVLKSLRSRDSVSLSPQEVGSWHGVGSDRSN
jgi:hypothetical protein